jgi:transcriptional regulator with XRE-family HTH domain
MSDNKTSSSTNFGQEVTSLLSSSGLSQASLARAIGKSPNHFNHVLTGRYSRPTASWADLVANALDLPDEARYRLHLAAAKDSGFKL